MSEERIIVRAECWLTFTIEDLYVDPVLVGARHTFPFDRFDAEIKLPTPKQSVGEHVPEDARIACHHYTAATKKPLSYEVYSVDLSMRIPEPLTIPAAVLRIPPTRESLFRPDELKKIKDLMHEVGAAAERAINYWVRILRWKSGIAAIVKPPSTAVPFTGDPTYEPSMTSIFSFIPVTRLSYRRARRYRSNIGRRPSKLFAGTLSHQSGSTGCLTVST